MYKIIAPDSQDFGDEAIKLIKVSNKGLVGTDKLAFEKRASAKLIQNLDGLDLSPGEELIHMIAIGATEDYGPNRNGDGFKRATCEKYHPTFVKHAKLYRNHEHKDPLKSYGVVKLSEYNPQMRRIELVVGLNTTKEAAEKNKGLVADKELEKLQSNKPMTVSMACKVAYDVCSYCGNKAPQTTDYCTDSAMGGTCKAGGLKHNLGKLVEVDGNIHHLHADNPHPTFFDISHVFRPADRIAYVTGMLKKTANDGINIISGADLAFSMGIVESNSVNYEIKKLAADLSDLENDDTLQDFIFLSPNNKDSKTLHISNLNKPQVFSELTKRAVLLPPVEFFMLAGDLTKEAAEKITNRVANYLPNIYTRLISENDNLDVDGYLVEKDAAPSVRNWCTKVAMDYAATSEVVQKNLAKSVLQPKSTSKPTLVKIATVDNPEIYELAKEYALYKLAVIHQNKNTKDINLMKKLAVLQNLC